MDVNKRHSGRVVGLLVAIGLAWLISQTIADIWTPKAEALVWVPVLLVLWFIGTWHTPGKETLSQIITQTYCVIFGVTVILFGVVAMAWSVFYVISILLGVA